MSAEDVAPPPITLNGSFETEFDFDDAAAIPQLGIKARGKTNRHLITQEKIGSTSFSATTQRVQYGTYHGNPACLIVIDFTFRFKPKVPARYSYASITITFRRATDLGNHRAPKAPPEDDPHVANMAPKSVYGVITCVEDKEVQDVMVLEVFENPLELNTGVESHAGMQRMRHAEHRMEIHGQPVEDDNHVDAPNGASWDLYEDPVAKDGILRNFRAVVVVLNPLGQPMWMEVLVKPSVRFSVDPRRLFEKNDAFAKLLQLNDQPVPLDGETPKEGQADLGCNDFTSPQFPWSRILRLPVENQVRLNHVHKPQVSKRSSSTTYRVRGIPIAFTEEQAKSLLETVCSIEPPEVVVTIHSLARNPHRDENVATVVFSKTPAQFQDESKDEWRLRSFDGVHDLFFDVHFRGLTPLAEPIETSVDIIAVSGLGGHAFGSFKERGGPHMWIRDSLVKDLPSARILTYGHDSHLYKSSSFQTLSDLGKQLQTAIHSIRNYSTATNPERPLILLGHSLGGLLISQALVFMSGGSRSDQANFKATYGILSFGTPNCGLNLESLVAMVENQPNRYFLETLRPNSEVLHALRKDFLRIYNFQDAEILSAYELKDSPTAQKEGDSWKMTGPPAILVDKQSSMQGRQWEHEIKQIGLNRNHSDLVKFHRYDEEYELISSRLQLFTTRAAEVIAKRFRNTE